MRPYDISRRCRPSVLRRRKSYPKRSRKLCSDHLQDHGPSFSVSAACATGAYNILLAAELIPNGHIEAAIAGGVEVCDAHFHAGFEAMRASNSAENADPSRASRPYARDRAGLVFGEAAGIVVLETRDHAVARGANIVGTIAGYGMTSDGSGKMVDPSSEGAQNAMQRALRHAGLSPKISTTSTRTALRLRWAISPKCA